MPDLNKMTFGNTLTVFDATQGYMNSSVYPNPANEHETRRQLMTPPNELKDYINNTASYQGTDPEDVVRLRVNGNGIEFSRDNENWTVAGITYREV